jgi:hypothetical protein
VRGLNLLSLTATGSPLRASSLAAGWQHGSRRRRTGGCGFPLCRFAFRESEVDLFFETIDLRHHHHNRITEFNDATALSSDQLAARDVELKKVVLHGRKMNQATEAERGNFNKESEV